MNSRLTLIFATLVLLLGGMVWIVQDRLPSAAAPTMVAEPILASRLQSPTAGQITAPTSVPTTVVSAARPLLQVKSAPMVHVNPGGTVEYVARGGDTASQLAIALLGTDSKEHRDAIIAANPSLQSNPDRVLEGQTYSIAPSIVLPADNAGTEERPAAAAITTTIPLGPAGRKAETPDADKAALNADGPKLKYTAQRGDTVRGLAANLLGGDTKANRDGIIAGNSSLQQDPDHLIAGKSYTIVARNGLSADPDARQPKAPTSQPDADDVVRLGDGRTLRYQAQTGDTVSKLAQVLLGSDTAANRDLIVKSNPSLKQDPDHLVAGRTYWIAAPIAD